MWDCKIDGGETVRAGYPELHIGVRPEDSILQVHGNLERIGDDTLRILGSGIQFIPGKSRSTIQLLDDGDPITFGWVGALLDNTMTVCQDLVLQTTFPNYGPIVTIRASQGGDSVTIEIVGGCPYFRLIDHDALDIVVSREAQKLRILG